MIKEPTVLTMQLASTLTPNQQAIFYGEYNHRARDYNTALLLAITTGWWAGGHKFYLGRPLQGVLHIAFFIFAVTIPVAMILTIIDVVNMHRTVNQINEQIAQEVLAKVRML